MTYLEAVQLLRTGGSWAELGEALGVVIASPHATLLDIALGLKYSGVIAEQAALCLYVRTQRSVPEDRGDLVLDIQTWIDWISLDAKDAGASPITRQQLVDNLARGLSRDEKLFLILYYFEEMTVTEIANVLNLTGEDVSAIRRRVLQRILDRFAPDTVPLSRLLKDLPV